MVEMKIELKKGHTEEKYSVVVDENDVVFINLKGGIGGEDCYPLYPVAIYTDNSSEIKCIELLWAEESWSRSSIPSPEITGQSVLSITETGEFRMKPGDDLSFQDDEADVLFDKDTDILLIKIGESKVQKYYKIAEDVIAGVVDDKLLVELCFLNFKSHYQPRKH